MSATIVVGATPTGVAVSPDGATAYVTSVDGTMSVINTSTDTVTDTFQVASPRVGLPLGVTVSPDGATAYVADEGDHSLAIVNTTKDEVTGTIHFAQSPFGSVLSPDGTRLYVADNNAVIVIDTRTDTVVGKIFVGALSVAISPDGSTIYAEGTDNNVAVIDSATGTVTATIPQLDGNSRLNAFDSIAISADGGTLYAADESHNQLTVDAPSAYAQTGTIKVGRRPDSVAISPGGTFAYVANSNSKSVSKISTSTDQVVTTIRVGDVPGLLATVPAEPGASAASWLHGLSCAASVSCVTVGTRETAAGTSALAMQGNQGSWHLINPLAGLRLSDPDLYQVTCRTTTDCVAVGTANLQPAQPSDSAPTLPVALAEKWNGHQWTASWLPLPAGATGSVMDDVSCPAASASCLAVGYYTKANGTALPLSDRRAGQAWKFAPVPEPSGAKRAMLTSVSCRATSCAAVGTYITSAGARRPLSEIWNGRRWQVLPMPMPRPAGNLAVTSVSCTAPAHCLAAGYTTTPHTPSSRARFEAKPFTERLAGSRWHTQPTAAQTPADSTLDGIACPAADNCIAVGGTYEQTRQSPLAESWNGTNWKIIKVPGPHGPTLTVLRDISCPAPRSCVAVGNYESRPLAERWNGRNWRVLPLPQS